MFVYKVSMVRCEGIVPKRMLFILNAENPYHAIKLAEEKNPGHTAYDAYCIF